MKLKKPFFSKELIYNNIKRFWWISVLFVLALFLVSPLVTLTNGSDVMPKSGYNIRFSDIFNGTIIFLFTVPVFIGVMVFRYIQNSKAMVMMHSMPYNRLRLYVNNIISGLILLIIPILLNAAFLSVIELGNLGGTYFKEGIILKYLGVSLLASVSLYFWTVFVGMFTGSSIAQIIFTYILNFLIAGLSLVVQYLLQGVLYGFVMNEEICLKFLKISPIVQIMLLRNYSPEYSLTHFLVIDSIICAVALILGYFVYKYRNLEDAGDVISGKYIKPFFKYGVTVCVMLVGGLYVREIFSFDKVNVFIYLLFALIGYVVAEMLIRKSFKILDSYKGFLVFAFVFIIILLGLNADLFGYEKYVPSLDVVKSVSIDSSPDFAASTLESPKYGILYENSNIENVINLHKKLIEDKNINLTEKVYTDTIYINYEMLDGRVVKRGYEVERDKYSEFINKIHDSKEYIVSTNAIFDYRASDVLSMEISSTLLKNDIDIVDKNEIEDILYAIKDDILNTTTAEKDEYRSIYRIGVTFKGEADSSDINTPDGDTMLIEKSTEYFVCTFNINSKNIDKCMTLKGYKDILLNTDDVKCINVYNESGEDVEDVKVITSSEQINQVMNKLYFSSDDVTFDKDISLEIVFKGAGSRWIDVEYDEELKTIIS